MNRMRDVPDHVGEIAFLPPHAVDVEPDLAAGGMTDFRYAMDGTDRRRLGEGLADVPRPLFLPHLVLQVAPRHVEPDGVAPDDAERVGRREIDAGAANRRDELELVMEVLRRERIVNA